MKEILSTIGKVISWAILTIAIACFGLGTENPYLMVPLYGIVFLVVLAALLYYQTKHKRRSFDDISTPVYLPLAAGAILLLFALLFPMISLNRFSPDLFNFISPVVVVLFTLILLAIGFGGVLCINKYGIDKMPITILGYILVIVSAAIPALVIAPIDSSYGTLGVLYFTTMIEVVIAWAGFNLLYNTLKK